MSRYKLFIKKPKPTVGYDDIELHPNFSEFIYTQERINVQNRIKLESTLSFGGDKLGEEYETLLGLRDLGKIPFWVQQFNGVDYTTLGYGYLITDAEWDDNSKVVVMNVETFSQYDAYDRGQETEVSTLPQDFSDALTYRRWDNKYKTKYNFSPIVWDEIEYMNTNATGFIDPDGPFWNNNNSGRQVLFDGAKDKIPAGVAWGGVQWNNLSTQPGLFTTFKKVKAVKEIRLYADSKWDLKQGLVQLLDINGGVIDFFILPPVAADPALVPHEQIHTFTNTLYGVKSIAVVYAALVAPDDWYQPIEYEFFTDHEGLVKTTNTVEGDFILQGANSLRMTIIDLLRANQTPNISAYDAMVEKIDLALSGSDLFNALVIPSGSVKQDLDDYEDISLTDLNSLLNDIIHKYIRINSSSVQFNVVDGVWFEGNREGQLISIKDINYKNNLGLDLTQYLYDNKGQLINWSKNLSTINISNLDKPRYIRYRSVSKNDFFKTIDVNFNKSIITNDPLEIPLDPWAFDIEGLQQIPDDFENKFMLAKCDIESEVSHYTQLNNTAITTSGYNPVDQFDLLDGTPWTNTALTSFTLTNNSVSDYQSCETNTFSLNAGDTVRVNTGDSDIFVLINLGGAAWQQLTNVEGVSEITVKDSATVKIALLALNGTYTIDISVDTILYSIVETDNVTNKDFSISGLLDLFIAEMPYDKASFNGFVDIDVHQKPDRKIRDIMFPLIPLANSIDLDEGPITDQGIIQPDKVSQQFNGDHAKLEGKFFKDSSFGRITEEGDNRITEEGDDRITE